MARRMAVRRRDHHCEVARSYELGDWRHDGFGSLHVQSTTRTRKVVLDINNDQRLMG
jgi:hypothetical protein